MCFLVSLFFVSVVSSAQWTEFRGPQGEGHTDAKLPMEVTGRSHVWKTPMPGKAWSSPVVWDNQVWFTNAEVDGHKLWAVCLNAKTGKVIHNKLVFEIKSPQKSPQNQKSPQKIAHI